MYINRKISSLIIEIARQYPIIFLTGARQVGKTTLLNTLFSNYTYLSFDLPSVAEQAETNPELFFSRYPAHAIFDEIQYVPSIFRYLKYETDKDPRKGRFIITGSQNFLLMKNITESLAGRCAILHLYPLSFSEIKATLIDSEAMSLDYIIKGGYPKLWAEQHINTEIFFSSYLATYIERDVRNILNIEKIREFERFFRALAVRSAQLLSYSDLARDVGVAVSTIKDWVNVLWASNQIFFLEPYYRNIGKRLIKSPKVYLCDTGLLCFMLNIKTVDDLLKSPLLGQIWETYVINQIIVHYSFRGIRPEIYFWRTRDGSEIDIILDKGGKISAFEIKFSEFIQPGDAASLNHFIHQTGRENIAHAGIISRTSHTYVLGETIQVLDLQSAIDLICCQ